MSTKRVSFLASLTADPQWRQKAGLDAGHLGQINTSKQDGVRSTRNPDSRIDSRAASPERRRASKAPIVHDVQPQRNRSSESTSESYREETPVVRRAERVHSMGGDEGIVARIVAQFGTPCAYDGRYCIWTTRDNGRTRDSFDVRDISRRVGLSVDTIVDALPTFAPVKRGRASVTPDEDSTE